MKKKSKRFKELQKNSKDFKSKDLKEILELIKKNSNAKMINIIGDQINIYRKKKYTQNEFFFDYLKKEIKDKRKMGHLTTLLS